MPHFRFAIFLSSNLNARRYVPLKLEAEELRVVRTQVGGRLDICMREKNSAPLDACYFHLNEFPFPQTGTRLLQRRVSRRDIRKSLNSRKSCIIKYNTCKRFSPLRHPRGLSAVHRPPRRYIERIKIEKSSNEKTLTLQF